jgi:16S rRNA (guanine527-N7)-methyltransferase
MQSRILEKLEQAGVAVSEAEAAKLAEYLALLQQWNKVYNLTGISDYGELIQRYLVESLAFRPYLKGERIADIGSGAGLPGIPLAITTPAVEFSLVESRGKRARFLRHVQGSLGLGNVSVEHLRAEDLSVERCFDTVLARAVAPPAELIELTRHLMADDGILLVLTKASFEDEISSLGPGPQVQCIKDAVTSTFVGSLVRVENAEPELR